VDIITADTAGLLCQPSFTRASRQPSKPSTTNSPTRERQASSSTRWSPTNGVSGLSTRLTERPEGRRLYDKLRAGDILVVRWVDRLDRNYEDVCDTIRHFMRRGVVIRTVINNFTFDGATKDPMQQAVRDALIGPGTGWGYQGCPEGRYRARQAAW
jgi:DNA invertase Pin-like site-specific DNA recombinase